MDAKIKIKNLALLHLKSALIIKSLSAISKHWIFAMSILKKLGCFIKVRQLAVSNKMIQLSLIFRFFMNRDLYSRLNKMLAGYVMTYKNSYPSKSFH
jgi:hypothetical protein